MPGPYSCSDLFDDIVSLHQGVVPYRCPDCKLSQDQQVSESAASLGEGDRSEEAPPLASWTQSSQFSDEAAQHTTSHSDSMTNDPSEY